MKHLPFNHTWTPLAWVSQYEPTDWHITDMQTVIKVRLFCPCGKTKTVQIADFPMTDDEINAYVKAVYDE